MENTILFNITEDQAKILCNYYHKNINDLEEYEICELLDRAIDDLSKLMEN